MAGRGWPFAQFVLASAELEAGRLTELGVGTLIRADMVETKEERLHAFRARSRDYLRLGHDRVLATRFVVETAGPLRGPALDIGTGKGLLAAELARRGLEVVSIDVDEQGPVLREMARVDASTTWSCWKSQ